MKNILVTLLIAILVTSCTEIIDVKLNETSPKLVVEATIYWEKGTNGSNQKIKLSTTGSFYSNSLPVVSGATVKVTNSSNVVFDFLETSNTGDYFCSNFIPVLNEQYTLSIVANGKTYTAKEKMIPVTDILETIQNSNGGIAGNKIQLQTTFLDPANIQNNYLFEYTYPEQKGRDIYVSDDIFFDGNEFSSFLQQPNSGKDLKAGDVITVSHTGISNKYYDFLVILLNLAGSGGGGGPFQAPPVSVRGNIINTVDDKDFPLGFFSLSEKETQTYTIQ